MLITTAYVHRGWGAEGSGEQVEANVKLLMNSLKAVEALCPGLQFITWRSGGKVTIGPVHPRPSMIIDLSSGTALNTPQCFILKLRSKRPTHESHRHTVTTFSTIANTMLSVNKLKERRGILLIFVRTLS
jgi:hypothetical protein